MRIAYICADPGIPIFGHKGASVHVQEVVRALLRYGAEIDLYAVRFDGDWPADFANVRIHALPALPKGLGKAAREQAALDNNQVLADELEQAGSFDIIYERYSLWSYAGMEFAEAQGITGLLEVNSPLVDEQDYHRGLAHRKIAEEVAQRAFSAATSLLAVSDGVAEYLGRFDDARGHIHVVPNGVDVDRIRPGLEPALWWPPESFTVGFVGTLKPWHGLDELVEAFALLYAFDSSVRLLIVGDGPCREATRARLAAHGLSDAAYFTGAVAPDSIPNWLASMDVAVAPYPESEDFYFSPLKVYEYMAAGVPVVVSAVGQLTDLIENGANGLLCEPGNPRALAGALMRLRLDRDLASRLGHAGRETIIVSHTWNQVAARILELGGQPVPAASFAPAAAQLPAQMAKPQTLRASLPALWRIISRLRPQLIGQWPILVGALLATFIGIGLRLLEPWPLKFIFDYLSGTPSEFSVGLAVGANAYGPSALIAVSSLLLVIIVMARAAATYFSTVFVALAGNRVLTQVRRDLYVHILRLSLSYHSRHKTGDLLTRLIGDIGRLQEVAVTALLPLLVSILTLIGMMLTMFWLNWQLALLAMVAFPLAWLSMARYTGRIRSAARKQRRRESDMAAGAAEALGAMRVIKSFSLEDPLAEAFNAKNRKSLQEGVQVKRLSARLERSVDIFIAAGTALVVWYGANLVVRQILTVGDLIVFMSYLKSAFRPMRNLAKYTGRIAKAVASGERVMEVLDADLDIVDSPTARAAPAFTGSIRFERVDFAYTEGYPTLKDISFEIAAGSKTAIVGPSGGGKSTLSSLLLRLYDPMSGCIKVDGLDIRSYTVASLRRQMSVVLQESVLFGVSVYDNIAYGAPGADRKAVEEAARLANAHDFIMALPDGYSTSLGERGATLSGGQRQRIAIARAAIAAAPIVILDEPTVGLDKESETTVHAALDHLSRGRTTIWITHNMVAAAGADLILYIERGRVIESGTHQELMALAGRYATMYRLQARAQESGSPALLQGDHVVPV